MLKFLRNASREGARLRAAMWVAIASCLAAPLMAMQFTDEVAWTGYDFAVAALLLVGGGAAIEASARSSSPLPLKALLGFGIIALVALIWAQGAVGVF